ncbi:uncharacterized protein [Arachis hypogaea]|uniref:uncharacterized protein n=1 Tax=Arachis hypogaea TaxID=3818 RepID=UPI003B21FB50
MEKNKGMSDVLPLDVIRRIFLRLPAKELFRLRCVSKLWHSLISDRDFAESHLNHSSVAPSHSCLFVNFLSVGYFVDVDTLAFKELSLPFSRKKRSLDFRVLGSCRGFVLLNRFPHFLIVWNPLTGSSKRISYSHIVSRSKIPGLNFHDHALLFGFGYDASQDDYLVVLAWDNGNHSQFHVDCFSLRTNSWISFDAALPKPFGHKMWESRGLFLHGAIHWLSCYGAYMNAILIFDLKEWSFSTTSIPIVPLSLSNGSDIIALLSTTKLKFAKYNVSGELLQEIDYPPLCYRPNRNFLTFFVYTESLLPFPADTKDKDKKKKTLVVLSSFEVASHGRRYVTCGRVPRCSFFEWIDNEDDMKGEWLKERRSCCFCGDSLILKSSNTPKNPNRRFMSCPSRRCKFFEWVDEEKKVRDVCLLSSEYHSGRVDGEIRGENAQERRVDRLSVDTERLKMEIGEVDDCVGRLCVELNSVQEELRKLEESMKKQTKMQMMFFCCCVTLIVAVLCGKVY